MSDRFPLKTLIVEGRDGAAGRLLAERPEFQILRTDKVTSAVRLAADAQAAGTPLEILLLDADLDEDAFRMARALLPGIPIVAFAGDLDDAAMESMISQGAQSCLEKDGLDAGVLASTLKQAVIRGRVGSRRFRALFDSAPIGILLAVGRRVVMANPSSLVALGRNEEEIAPLSVLELFPPESRSILEKALDASGSGSGVVPETSFTAAIGRPDGAISRCRVFVTGALLNDAPAVALYLAPVTDAADAPAEAEHLRQVRKMEALGRLAGGIAHDFNNLLTAVNGYSEHLLTITGKEGPLASGLSAIRSAGDTAVSLTRRLLTFSKSEHPGDAALRVDSALLDMAPMLRKLLGAGIDLRLELGAASETARMEPGQFEQILLNLCANAKDAMPAGGTLTIRTEALAADSGESFTHLAAGSGPRIVVTVEDTGTGMLPETLESLFEPFYTTKRGGRGTGLGLASVYGIVNRIGGGISVQSKLGHGSRFRIHLPCVGALHSATIAKPLIPGTAVRAPASSWRQDENRESILVVDDDSGLREMLRAVLERFGYSVRESVSAYEAIEMLERSPEEADLVVTDMMLRGESGLELARNLWSIKPGLPVLFISGHSLDTLADQGLIVPAEAFLEKPFPPALLGAKVRALLNSAKRVS